MLLQPFSPNSTPGPSRSFPLLSSEMSAQGREGAWREIDGLVVKSVLTALPDDMKSSTPSTHIHGGSPICNGCVSDSMLIHKNVL